MRRWRTLLAAALLTLLSAVPAAQGAETLYAASVSGYNASTSEVGAGVLYKVDPSNGAATRVALIRADGKDSIGVTGLAFHPATGALYGITGGLSPHIPHSLVTIDAKTGDAKVIGPLGVIGSDISFDRDGRLHMWIPAVRQVGIVDLATGAVKMLGDPGTPGSTGGLSIDERGEILVAASGTTSRIDTIDAASGELKRGPPLVNAPYAAINSLTISRGVLYAVNSNMGAPASTRLVTIDRKSGEVTNLGALPPDTDALAFLPAGSSAATPDFNWKPILIALAVIIVLVTGAFTIVRPQKR